MKKIRLLLAIIAACIGSLQGAWAERVAPTMPETQTLESGKTYFLYNVLENKFLCRSTIYSSEAALGINGDEVLITATEEDNGYTIKWADNNFLLMAYNDYIGSTDRPYSWYDYFIISESSKGYTIQRSTKSSYFKSDEFVGYNGSNGDRLTPALSEGSIHWVFFSPEDGHRYGAELRLYNALNTIEAYGKGWYIENYKDLYDDRANQTVEDLLAAAIALEKSTDMSAGYQAPWWNERPIMFYTADGSFGQSNWDTWALPDNSYTRGTCFRRYLNNSGETSSISATVLIEEPSTLVYSLSDNPTSLDVYLDDVLVRHFGNEQCNHSPYVYNDTYTRFFLELTPGLHTITWKQTSLAWKGYSSVELRNIGVMASPLITVSLLEPGSLGTEILYNTDHIKNVRRLKVKGAMNADDWAKIKMMSTLQELDLSEAQFTEIPTQQFRLEYNDTTMVFLHKVALPEGLTKINDEAFRNSFVEDINFPSTLQSIGYRAFYMCHILEAILPDNLTEMEEEVFRYAYWLKKAHFGKNLTTIPMQTFDCAYPLNDVVLPEKLNTVGDYAFYDCHDLQTTLPNNLKTVGSGAFVNCWNYFNPRLPEGLTTIRNGAFNTCNAMDSVVVPRSVTTLEEYAFCNCQNLKYAELSVEQYTTPTGIFDNTPKLETIKLNSATVVSPTISGSVYPHRNISQITLKVPHYLVNEYKLHNYWYNAKAIEPFDYSDVDFIPIHGNLTLNHERFGGQPSVYIYNLNSYLKINGDAAQAFNDFALWRDINDRWGYGMMLSNCQNLSIAGDVRVVYKTQAKQWNFISLPFDLDVSRINPGDGVQFAIRYYDGAGRAANGKSGNWKNVDRTSIIPAGTGFILQTNVDCWTSLYAADNETKQNMVACTEFNKALEVNASETASNRGWNLVGNPYQCFYNNHCLNFTAPITVWNPDNNTYTAYSLTDDDYAIRPNEAFFVQCPNEEYNTIGFPLQGRQLTSVIESQNAARAATREVQTRKVVNLTISDGEWEDQTRIVLNEEASEAYETMCDASKFMSMDNSVPQIYTIDSEGTQYAINERSLGEGTVALGYYAGQNGVYTISVTRSNAEQVFITDNLTGETADITDGTYTFSANAGTNNSRFVLSFVPNITDIKGVENAENDHKTDVYSIDGRFLGNDVNGLGAGAYILRQGKKVSKVIVR